MILCALQPGAWGKTAELFRTWPGVKRSSHPQNSFAALGPKAPEIVAEHPLDHPFGVCSPLEKLYQLGGQTLFLGVGFHRFTMLHLAETRAWPHRPREQQAAPVMEHNERVWKRFSIEPAGETGHFMPIGEALLANGIAQAFAVGAGRGMLVACRDAVDFALERWSKRPDPVFGTSGNER
ncbi:AAC(3) family N-acetyltransferase [uncultured Cohaesibacter sp.]|uniref:AAC(3) family N-acetyltransferase n=1 Tax=uncultured Cohaesibacter sp. TaxID=1002546 RepID=UPI00292D6E5D|nr:AAC(3) family N-acetyltransferase [uncultured Cohaesibacter sp.]